MYRSAVIFESLPSIFRAITVLYLIDQDGSPEQVDILCCTCANICISS